MRSQRALILLINYISDSMIRRKHKTGALFCKEQLSFFVPSGHIFLILENKLVSVAALNNPYNFILINSLKMRLLIFGVNWEKAKSLGKCGMISEKVEWIRKSRVVTTVSAFPSLATLVHRVILDAHSMPLMLLNF